MRKAFLLFLVVLGTACTALSQQPTATAVTKDTVVQDGVTLVVGEDYSWDGQVKAKNLQWKTPEFTAARARVLAFQDAVEASQAAAKAGDWAKAEILSPQYVVKAFYGLNHLRALMGGSITAGHWHGYKVAGEDPADPKYTGPNGAAIAIEFKQVLDWVAKARAAGAPKDGRGHDVSVVEGYLADYKDGILSEVVQ